MGKIILSVLMGLYANSAFSHPVTLENLNLNFRDNHGTATSNFIKVEHDVGEMQWNDLNSEFVRGENGVEFRDDKIHAKIKTQFLGDFAKVAALGLSNAHIYLDPGKLLNLSFDSVSLDTGKGETNLGALALKCKDQSSNAAGPESVDINAFIAPCLKLGSLKIPHLDLPEKTTHSLTETVTVQSLIESGLINQENPGNEGLKPKSLDNILLYLINNSFQLSLETKILIKIKLIVQGLAALDQEHSQMSFTIQKAKIGIIPVKSLLMKAIAEAKIDNVTVAGDRITVQL